MTDPRPRLGNVKVRGAGVAAATNTPDGGHGRSAVFASEGRASQSKPRSESRAVGPKGSQGNPFTAEIVAFCCNYCAYAAADLAGSRRMQYSPEVRVIHVPCTGKVEPEHILAAFEKGADGVLIAGCLEGGCHFLEGNLRAKRRAEHLRQVLEEIGISGERLRMVNLSAAMAPTFVQRVHEMVDTVHRLGPNPLRSIALSAQAVDGEFPFNPPGNRD